MRLLPIRECACFCAAAAAVFVADAATKHLVFAGALPAGALEWLPFVAIAPGLNTGMAFGLGVPATVALALATAALLGVAVYAAAFCRQLGPLGSAAAGAVFGGGAGNLADRVALGGVQDFIAIGYFPVFNLADAAITLGALIVGGVLLIRPT